jgi:hypothetical protein
MERDVAPAMLSDFRSPGDDVTLVDSTRLLRSARCSGRLSRDNPLSIWLLFGRWNNM